MQKTAAMYWSIFLRTAGWLALAALTAAQGYDWANEKFVANTEVVGWSLLGAGIAGVLAVAWSFASSPAVTAMGKALRQAVQVVLALPIAGIALDSVSDVLELGDLIVPSVVAAALAFVVTLLANRLPAPAVGATKAPTPPTPVHDFIGAKAAA